MTNRLRPWLLIALLGLTGCGSDRAISDPTQLPPLTEQDKREIKENDARIETEERGQPVIVKRNARS